MRSRGRRRECRVRVAGGIGLHARPAALLVKLARSFESDIALEYNGLRADAKSILGILTLGAEGGAEVKITAEGADSARALGAVRFFLASGFPEADAVGMRAGKAAGCGTPSPWEDRAEDLAPWQGGERTTAGGNSAALPSVSA